MICELGDKRASPGMECRVGRRIPKLRLGWKTITGLFFFFFSYLFFLSYPLLSKHTMSSNVPISGAGDITAPTPQNTPLNQAPIALGLSRPTVPDISEDNEGENAADEGNENPSLAGLEQHMLGMVHGRLADLLGKSSGYIESLPVEIKLNVEALKGVQVKQNALHQQYKKECLELEKKVCFLILGVFSLIFFLPSVDVCHDPRGSISLPRVQSG